MALTRRARRSNCSGRTSLRDALCGSNIWRDFLDGGFRQGIESNRSSGQSEAWSALSDLSLMISLSRCTTMPATSCARSPRSPKGRVPVADLPWLGARCSFRERERPIRLTRSWPLHAGQASRRSSDSERRLLWHGLESCDGRHRRTAVPSVGGGIRLGGNAAGDFQWISTEGEITQNQSRFLAVHEHFCGIADRVVGE